MKSIFAIAKAASRSYITPEDIQEALRCGADKNKVRRDVLKAISNLAVEDSSRHTFARRSKISSKGIVGAERTTAAHTAC
jgi:hypothetical protein